MFRPMRRASRAIPEEAAKHLLQQSRRGVLAVNGDNGYPFAIPVNYYYDQEHDKIYFHGAKSGQKVDALKQNDKVCFTVYGNEHFEPGDWAPYVQSTVVFGRCHLIDDAAATEARVRELGMKYYPGKEEVEKEIALDIKAVQLYEITIEHLTGKQIHKFQDLICLLFIREKTYINSIRNKSPLFPLFHIWRHLPSKILAEISFISCLIT